MGDFTYINPLWYEMINSGIDDMLKEQSIYNMGAGRCVMGIDPGVTGGVAFLWPDKLIATDIPVVAGEVNVDDLVNTIRLMNPRLAVIERASSMPGQGVSSTFKFGAAYGALRAAVAALGIPSHLVSAAKWKRSYGLSADKEKSRALAIRMWPGGVQFNRKKDHGRAEAALIAQYGAGIWGGKQ